MEQKSFYNGKTVVFTGRLETMRRVDAAKLVTSAGAVVAGMVTKHTDIVVIGSNVGEDKRQTRKYRLAKESVGTEREVVIVTEDEFLLYFI